MSDDRQNENEKSTVDISAGTGVPPEQEFDADSDFDLDPEGDFPGDDDLFEEEIPVKKKSSGGFLKWVLVLGIVGAGGWYGYTTFLGMTPLPARPAAEIKTELPSRDPPAPLPARIEGLPAPADALESSVADDSAEADRDAGVLFDRDTESLTEETALFPDTLERAETVPDLAGDEDEMPPPPAVKTAAVEKIPLNMETKSVSDAAPTPEFDWDDDAGLPMQEEETVPENSAGSSVSAAGEDAALAARLDSLVKSMAALTEKLGEIEAAVSGLEAVTADQVARQDMDSLQRSLKTIDRRLVKIEQSPPAAAADSSSPSTSSARPAVKKQEPERTAPEKQVQAATRWILRSARSGVAWVSGEDQAELREIRVGDSLPDAGKVLDITKDSRGWVVRTTTRDIRP